MTRISTRKQLIVMAVLIVAAIIGASYLIISMQRQAAIDAFRTAMTNLANGMARQTEHYLSTVDQALRTVKTGLATTPDPAAPERAAGPGSASVHGLLYSQLAGISGVDELLLIGADGRVVNTSLDWPAKPVDLSGRDYFRHFKTLDDPALFVGMPEQDPASGAWTLPLALRIDAARGGFAGVIMARISLADLTAFYQLAMPPHRTLYLARRDGLVLLGYPALAADIGRRIPPASPWYRAVAAGGGAYDGPGFFSPAPVIAVVRSLQDAPIILEATCAQSEALSQWARERIWVGAGRLYLGPLRARRAAAVRAAVHPDRDLGTPARRQECRA